MKLKQLIETFASLSTQPDVDLELEVIGITDDSRKVAPGMIFIAIKGYQFDGHQYIMDAAQRGGCYDYWRKGTFKSDIGSLYHC